MITKAAWLLIAVIAAAGPGPDPGPEEPKDLDSRHPKSGDINADGLIDAYDFVELLEHWGRCDEAPCPADLDDDDFVGISDLLLLVASWDSTPLIAGGQWDPRSI